MGPRLLHRRTQPGFHEALSSREWRAIFAAATLSTFGDELARFAVAFLVFRRTDSPLLTAATYAVTLLPSLAGVFGLSGLGDAMSRRWVMIGCDVLRAAVFGLLVATDLPIPALYVVVFVAGVAGPPFAAARAALMSQILTGDAYVSGHAATEVAKSAASAVAVLAGGLAIALIGTKGAFAVDAATFVASAVLLTLFVEHRPATATSQTRSWLIGVRVVVRTPSLRWLVAVSASCGAAAAVAASMPVVLAARDGHGAAAAGFLAGVPLVGEIVMGSVIVLAVAESKRQRLIFPLALLSVVPLVLCVGAPGFYITCALFVLATIGSMFQVLASQEFVVAVPNEHRAAAFGVAAGAITLANGLGILIAGVASDYVEPVRVVGIAGAVAAVLVVAVTSRHAQLTVRMPGGMLKLADE